MHVLLLPPATLLLIALHVFLVRKHGVAPAPGDELLPKKKFFPAQVFKDTVAIFVAFAILFTLALVARVPLEQLADPTDTTYIPRPEWYFLFLFQTLKLFPGPLEVVGSVVLPGLAILTLILVPFLDRGRLVSVTKRTFAIGVVLLVAIGWGGLTAAAVATTPKAAELAVDYSAPTDWLQLTPQEMSGIAYFRQEQCQSCHSVGDGPSKIGPGSHDSVDSQRRRLDDPAFQTSGNRASRNGDAAHPIERRAAQFAGGVSVEAHTGQCQRLGKRSRFRHHGRVSLPGQSVRELSHGE